MGIRPLIALTVSAATVYLATAVHAMDPPAVKEHLDALALSYAWTNSPSDLNGTTHDTKGSGENAPSTRKAFMGSVLVADGDQVLLNKGYGSANLEKGIPNTPDVIFRIGSLTKQFTAALVLLLQEEGKLKINDPVEKYLPAAPMAWSHVSLTELLGHTSGIPNFTSDKEFATWSLTTRTPEEEFAFFRDKPLQFEPGSKFEYSNSNYCVLGLIIEKVSGKRYGDLLRERIFNPLGMKNSGLDSDDLLLPRRASGYRLDHGVLKPAASISMSIVWAAGGIYSTTQDLMRWEQSLFGGKVLSKDSLKAMTTAGKGSYGLGVKILDRNGLRIVQHEGTVDGYDASMAYAPQRRIAVIVLSNVNGPAPSDLLFHLLDFTLENQPAAEISPP